MFESQTNLLRDHILRLQTLLEENEGFDPEELEDELAEIEQDIQDLKDDLPYDEIDEFGEDIEDFSDEELEEGELEDEVVEAESVIEELEDLIQEVRSRLEEADEEIDAESPSKFKATTPFRAGTVIKSEQQLDDKLQSWMIAAFKEKNARGGAHESDDVLARRARTLLIAIRTHDAPSPEFGLTAEEIASARAFSPAVTSISTGMIELYGLLSERFPESDFVFENVLRKIGRSWMKVYGKL